ncbi:MAG: cobalamin-dependent protein [Planctomycetes bacterium]|nr:cobalamin-dependent protein [Planctomycetota bacterium]
MRIVLVGAELEENLALRSIWAALDAAGHHVSLVVFNDSAHTEDAARRIASSSADLAGFSMVFTYRAAEFARLAARSRELGYAGHLTAGGHFAAFNAAALLSDVPAFDSVALGEGEEIMCRLARSLHDLPSVPGLVYRDASGCVHTNAPAEKPADLDSRPFAVHRRPFDTYLGLPIVNMLSSRGCTHSCAFCSISAWHRLCGGERFRMRRPGAVADEMAALYNEGARIFNFHDDNFLPRDPAAAWDRARSLGSAFASRGLTDIAFAIKARPDEVDRDLFAYLKSIGLFRVFLGVEAGTAESLRRLGRGQSLSDNERALDVVNLLDIHCCFNLLMLNPDSTLDDFAANVAFLKRRPHNPMNFCRTEIYAGTPLEIKLRRENRLIGDYWGYDYLIADPGAQLLFELVYTAFCQRNYGDRGVHHKVMEVDYEHQVLSHFFGTSRSLRRRTKDYIAAVNLNTCAYLDELVAAVKAGFRGPAARSSFLRGFSARIAADDRLLYDRGSAILSDVRSFADRSSRSGFARWAGRTAAAAGLVAAIVASEPGCIPPHVCEMAPEYSGPPFGDQSLLRDDFSRLLLARIAARVQPSDIEVLIVVDRDGRASDAYVLSGGISGADRDALSAIARSFTTDNPDAFGKSFRLAFSAAELRAAAPQPAPAPEPSPETGDPALIHDVFTRDLLPDVAGFISWKVDSITIAVRLDAQGGIAEASVSGAGVNEATAEAIVSRLLQRTVAVPQAFGKRFILYFGPEDLKAAIRSTLPFEMAPRPPHMHEMVPRPHMHERVPAPPRPPAGP